MANSSIALTSLDFDSYKNSLKKYLQKQANFKDYDYEASNMNVLLDVLAYNTYMNAFYMNMIGNEMFLDSAQMRDSVVSHAKELNYVPRSFRSARAQLEVVITTSDSNKKNITIPKGTTFSTRVGSNTFLFTTEDNIAILNRQVSGSNYTFTTSLDVYEGDYVSETYAINYTYPSRYIINNKNIDLSSLTVTVVEDNSNTVTQYSRSVSLFEVDETSEVFFVQSYAGDKYEIIFGDGVVGKQPKNNSVVILEYRICNGELPNGSRVFRAAEPIDGETNISIKTISSASGGSIYESIESIKYNAPRAFTTQERAVTAEDYENLLKANYPEINAVSAFGGEDADPPQYGRVFVSVDLKDIDGLPRIKEEEYKRFLRSRSTVSMEPIFISPEYTYLNVDTIIKYNINVTDLNPEDIRTLVLSSILNFSSQYLDGFSKTLRYSKFVEYLDDTDQSIVSNETDVRLVKYFTPYLNTPLNLEVDYKIPLLDNMPEIPKDHIILGKRTIMSSSFKYNGQTCELEDDGAGNLRIVTSLNNEHKTVAQAGTVNYATGKIKINNLKLDSYSGSFLKIYAITKSKDIITSKNVILNISESDVSISIQQVRE